MEQDFSFKKTYLHVFVCKGLTRTYSIYLITRRSYNYYYNMNHHEGCIQIFKKSPRLQVLQKQPGLRVRSFVPRVREVTETSGNNNNTAISTCKYLQIILHIIYRARSFVPRAGEVAKASGNNKKIQQFAHANKYRLFCILYIELGPLSPEPGRWQKLLKNNKKYSKFIQFLAALAVFKQTDLKNRINE